MRKELTPNNKQQKSFYGKAFVEVEPERVTLISYESEVAHWFPEAEVLLVHKELISATTKKHLVAFVNQYTTLDTAEALKDVKGSVKFD